MSAKAIRARFYLIAAGQAAVQIDGTLRRSMGPPDGFGEIALLRDVPAPPRW